MPFDSQGIHTLPLGYLAVTGQTVLASNHNPPLEDISSSLSQVLLRSGVAPMIGNLKMNGFRITGLGDGTAATDAATKGQVDSAIPAGSVMDFAGATAPAGWLFCFGQAISRTTHAPLFAAIGTVYGVGDGSNTFNLPDCRGRVSAGKDDMGGTSANRLTNQTGGVNGDTLGGTGGAETHVLTEAQLAAHNHGGSALSAGSHTHTLNGRTQSDGGDNDLTRVSAAEVGAPIVSISSSAVDAAGAHTHTIPSAGSGTGHNNVQPTIMFNKIIRTGI